MSFFFEEDTAIQVKSTESISKGERTDFMENASKAFNAFRRSEIFTSEGNNQEEEYVNIVNILTAAGHSDYISPLEVNTDPLSEDGDMGAVFKTRDELQKNFWDQVAVLQTTDENLKNKLTEAGLDNFENMQKTIATKTQNAWKDYTEVNERATTAGWWGGMGGMAGAAFTDPIMLMTIPISFGYSVPAGFSAAALKIGLMEGIIGGVAETIIQLKAQPYRAELGFEDAGFVTGAKNVGMVTLASATLSPLLFGTFKAFGKGIDVGKKFLHKQTPEDLQTIFKEMGEINPKLKDKDLTEFELPKKDSPFEDTAPARVEHNERLDTAARAIENGEPVDLPPIRSTLETPTPTKIEFNDITASNPAIKNTYDGVNRLKVFTEDKAPITVKMLEDISKDDLNKILRANELGLYKSRPEVLIAADMTKNFTNKKGKINYENAQFFIRKELKGTETLDELLQLERSTRVTETPKVAEVETVSKNFNKEPTRLADDQNNVRDFDVPNEAAYRNQASNIERSVFDVSTSSSIRSVAGAGAAAKTSPTVLSDATQVLAKGSQKTEATPVSVLANANTVPPLFRGLDTSRVGSKSAITNKTIYHISDDFNTIYKTLSGKKNEVLKELQPIANKYNGDLKARIKAIKEINKKLKHTTNPKKPEHISDYLGTRISVKTIHEAKMLLNDLNKVVKFLDVDDFLNDAGRVVESNTEYRAIHAQVLTKDGFSFELQIRLKELEPLTNKSHESYKKAFSKKEMTNEEFNILQKELRSVNKKLKAKYFQIKDKEFARLKSEDPLDTPIPVSQRLDDVTGERIPLTITAREAIEQAAKDETMLNRLKDCV
jgi:ppGpp synthetase/RelA/SpoT-type nucleotidyltranferase